MDNPSGLWWGGRRDRTEARQLKDRLQLRDPRFTYLSRAAAAVLRLWEPVRRDRMTDCFWPLARIRHDAKKRPHGMVCGRSSPLDFSLLRNLQRVVNLDAKIAYGTFKLGMSKQQLDCSQVLRPLVNQCCLGASHRMHPVDR